LVLNAKGFELRASTGVEKVVTIKNAYWRILQLRKSTAFG
jgi:hypothetical protein